MIGVFLDLTKAFDAVSVPMLQKKNINAGIRGISLLLIADYLTNRTMCVRFNDWLSHYGKVQFGVPQDSILGPILFLINDLYRLKIMSVLSSANVKI